MDQWFFITIFAIFLTTGILIAKRTQVSLEFFTSTIPRQPNCSCEGQKVRLWQHCTKSGWFRDFCLGEYDAINNEDFPKDASYIIVPKGYKATLYADGIGKGGRSKVVKGGEEFNFCTEGLWANDNIKALRIESEDGGFDCPLFGAAPAPAAQPQPQPPQPVEQPSDSMSGVDSVNLYEFGRHRSFMIKGLDIPERKPESGLLQKNIEF